MVKRLQNIEHQDCSDAEVLISVKAEKVDKQIPSSNDGGSESIQIRAYFPKSADASKPRLSGFVARDTIIVVTLWCVHSVTSLSAKACILTRTALKFAILRLQVRLEYWYSSSQQVCSRQFWLCLSHIPDRVPHAGLHCPFRGKYHLPLLHLSKVAIIVPLPVWQLVGKAQSIMRYLYTIVTILPATSVDKSSEKYAHWCVCSLVSADFVPNGLHPKVWVLLAAYLCRICVYNF